MSNEWFVTSKRSSRSLAASKANETTRNRKLFQDAYPYTYDIARAVLEGRVELLGGFIKSTVAAVKANLSRPGRYRDMALACNYKPVGKCKRPKK